MDPTPLRGGVVEANWADSGYSGHCLRMRHLHLEKKPVPWSSDWLLLQWAWLGIIAELSRTQRARMKPALVLCELIAAAA